MVDLAQRDEHRSRMLQGLYKAVDGRRVAMVSYQEVADAIGIGHSEAEVAAEWLVDSGCAEWASMGGLMRITREGIAAVEDAMRETEDAEPPPAEGGGGVYLLAVEKAQLEELLGELRTALESPEVEALAPEDRADLDAQYRTLEAQYRSPRTLRSVVKAAATRAHELLPDAGSVASVVSLVWTFISVV